MSFPKTKTILIAILILTLFLRLPGLLYGLPLWVVDDEPPFTLAALKMLQLKTVIPTLHTAEFKNILYDPPYLSYLYLIPFTLLTGIKYALSDATSLSDFVNYMALDLSDFFILARLINILLAVLSVFLLYKIAENLFDDKTALLASFFLSTSLIHMGLSIVARHWLIESLIFITILYFLTKKDLPPIKKFLWGMMLAGIGIGFGSILSTSVVLIYLWFLTNDTESFKLFLGDKKFYLINFLFLALTIASYLLYPLAENGFKSDLTTEEAKTLFGLIKSPILFLKPIFFSDLTMSAAFFIGLFFLWKNKRELLATIIPFIYIYSGAFYLTFRYEHRFTLPIVPLIALVGAYGLNEIFKKNRTSQVSVILLFLIVAMNLSTSTRLSYLMYQNDSRVLARKWAERNIKDNSKVIVSARLMRLTSNKEAITEQEKLDPGSLRKVDEAERLFDKHPLGYKNFHALNLYSVKNGELESDIENYATKNNYEYVILSRDSDLGRKKRFALLENLTREKGQLLKTFGNPHESSYSIAYSRFTENPLRLFEIPNFGQVIDIYKLNNK